MSSSNTRSQSPSTFTKPIFITRGAKKDPISHVFRISHVTSVRLDSNMGKNEIDRKKYLVNVHYITENGPGMFPINMREELVEQLSSKIAEITRNDSICIDINPLLFAFPLPESMTTWTCSECKNNISAHNYIYTVHYPDIPDSEGFTVNRRDRSNIVEDTRIFCYNCANKFPEQEYDISRIYSTNIGDTYIFSNISEDPQHAKIFTLYQDIQSLHIYSYPVKGSKLLNTMIPSQPAKFTNNNSSTQNHTQFTRKRTNNNQTLSDKRV